MKINKYDIFVVVIAIFIFESLAWIASSLLESNLFYVSNSVVAIFSLIYYFKYQRNKKK